MEPDEGKIPQKQKEQLMQLFEEREHYAKALATLRADTAVAEAEFARSNVLYQITAAETLRDLLGPSGPSTHIVRIGKDGPEVAPLPEGTSS